MSELFNPQMNCNASETLNRTQEGQVSARGDFDLSHVTEWPAVRGDGCCMEVPRLVNFHAVGCGEIPCDVGKRSTASGILQRSLLSR